MKKYILIFLATGVSLLLQSQTVIPGNFSGSLDVGPTGNAAYTIPLDLPPGIGGFQPELAIAYNSQGGDGTMGKGFSISGLSSIARRKSTLFHEGAIKPAEFNSTDKYMYDGNILISSGTNEFKTEVNSASRIKINSPNSSTANFEVKTRDGLVYEYGNTTDSRLHAQGGNNTQVAVWMLNKVKDRSGKYYSYTYEKDNANGEIRIKQIDYTGSASISPFYSVKFIYIARNYDINLSYVSGSKFKESKLLDRIEVYYGSTIVRKYSMQYLYFDYNHLLTQVTVAGQKGEVLKPLIINWQLNSDFKQTQVKYDQTSNLSKANITLGDFNGDGKTDFVATPAPGAGWTGWKLYLANADGNGFTFTSSGSIVEGLIRLIPGDFNGDGITDFIAHRCNGNTNVVYASAAEKERLDKLEEYLDYIAVSEKVTGDGSEISFMTENDSSVIFKKRNENPVSDLNSPENTITPAAVSYDNYFVYYGTGSGFTYTAPAIMTITRPHNVKLGDFNGDGAMDLFAYYTSKSGTLPDYEIKASSYSGGTTTALSTTYTGRLATDDNWERVEVWDFNGDGLAEVMNLHENGYHYYKNTGGNITKLRNSTFPKKKHKINFGDFNGDGKTDMLLTGYDNMEWSEWQTHLSTGLDFERFYFPKKFNSLSKEIFVCDLNGDGMDDFFAVDKSASSLTPVMYYLGYNCGRDFRGFTGISTYGLNLWNFYPINSRGDGRYGFITNSATGTWNGYQLYMPPADFTNLVKSFKDPYGNETVITYRNMADASVYTKTNPPGGSAVVSGYDWLPFVFPFKLVSNVRTNNGIGGYRDMAYKYENMRLFKRGRGLLGFTKIIRTDVNNSVQKTITQEFCNSFFHPSTKNIEDKKTSTGRVLSLVEYVNTLKNSNGIFSFIPSSATKKIYEPTNNNVVESEVTTYTYDAYNNVTKEVTTYGNGDKTDITNTIYNNTDNNTWIIGQLKKKTVLTTVNGASQTNTVEYAYNANGLLEKETIEPLNAQLKIETTNTYDAHGNITKITKKADTQTRTEQFIYPSVRFLEKYINVQGDTTSYKYYADNGLMLSESFCGVTNSYTYDGLGRIKTSTSNTGETSTVTWSWTNGSPAYSVVCRTEALGSGQELKTWYDALGREIQYSEKNFEGRVVTTRQSYNALGQLVSVSEPYFTTPGLSVTYEYDTYGRLQSESTFLGKISYGYSSMATGAKTTVTDKTKGESFTSTRTYDLAGKLKTIADSGGETITYTYGSSGNPASILCGVASYTMEYDLLGRQKRLTDPAAGTINYKYNGWGDLIEKRDSRGKAEKYTYDASGKISVYERGDERFTYAYNTSANKPKDQIINISKTGMKTEYAYDSYGRNTKVTETIETGKSFVFEYKYNGNNQLEQTVYPGGKVVKYEYGYGDLKKITWVPTGVAVWEKLTGNARGQVLTEKLGNGMQTAYAYTSTGIPSSIRSMNGTTAMLDISYPEVDSRGNIKQRKDVHKNSSESFTYDNLNRLSSGVTYRPNGNIATKEGVGTYTYGSSVRPFAVTEVSNAPFGTVDNDLTVTYNDISLPLEIALSPSHKYTLTYGTDNQRVKSVYVKPGATTETKYYVGPYEEIVRGTSVQKNYYIYAKGEIAAVYTEGHPDLSSGIYYFHNDHLGSPWLVTNSSKTEVQRLSYDAWGRRRDPGNWTLYSGLPAMKFSRGYTGHEHLDMFSLINMNARLYDPVLGRFLSPDPFVQAPDFSQTYNRYSYALNNPMMYTDPDGEFVWFVPVIAALVGGTIGGIKAAKVDGMNFWDGFWRGGIVGAASGFLAPIGGAGMAFGTNLLVGAAQGAAIGALDAALWGNNIGKSMLWGATFATVTTTLTSENFRNMMKGKGFYNNQKVFNNFASGKYIIPKGSTWQQEVLNYFGFEGTYDPNADLFQRHGAYPGITDVKTGDIFYHDYPFEGNFDRLALIADHERVHRRNVLSGKYNGVSINSEIAGLEEWNTYLHNYKNQGLYRKHNIPLISRLNYYGNQAGLYETYVTPAGVYSTQFNKKWWHFLYKTPRRW